MNNHYSGISAAPVYSDTTLRLQNTRADISEKINFKHKVIVQLQRLAILPLPLASLRNMLAVVMLLQWQMKGDVLVEAEKEEKEVYIEPPLPHPKYYRNDVWLCGCSCVCIWYVSAYDHNTLRMPVLVCVFVCVKILCQYQCCSSRVTDSESSPTQAQILKTCNSTWTRRRQCIDCILAQRWGMRTCFL